MFRILVADDDSSLRYLVTETLRLEENYLVFEANDGAEALNKALEIEPHLIIVDYTMPALSGLDVICRLSEKGKLPGCILLSALEIDDQSLIKYCDNLIVMKKPFELISLLENTERILSCIKDNQV